MTSADHLLRLAKALLLWVDGREMSDDDVDAMKAAYRDALTYQPVQRYDTLYRGISYSGVDDMREFTREYIIGSGRPPLSNVSPRLESWTSDIRVAREFTGSAGTGKQVGVLLERDDINDGKNRNVLFDVNIMHRYLLAMTKAVEAADARTLSKLASTRSHLDGVEPRFLLEYEILLKRARHTFRQVRFFHTTDFNDPADVVDEFARIGWKVAGVTRPSSGFECRLDHGSRTLRVTDDW